TRITQIAGLMSDSGRQGSGLYNRGVAGGAGGLDGAVAAHGLHLLHNPVHMILDGKLREIQVRGDLLIRQSLGDKGNELLLAYGEAGDGSALNLDRRLLGISGHRPKERKA